MRAIYQFLIAVAVLLVIFASGYLLFGNRSSETESFSEENNGVAADPLGTTTRRNVIQQPEDPYRSCREGIKNEIKNQNIAYEAGTILVSFVADTTFAEAVRAAATLSLTIDSSETEATFQSKGWLTVRVPKGSEVEYVCRIKSDPVVKNAILNRTFELWQ